MKNFQEAKQRWAAHAPQHAANGVVLPDAIAYLPESFKANFALAMDAAPQLATTTNAGIPAFLSTLVDPAIFEIIFAPNKASEIFGEVRKGSWTDQTAMFPQVEHTGEVSSYGDFNNNGNAGVNPTWPQRQSYLFQTIKEYGELQLDRAGLGKINLVSEIDKAAATVLNKYQNLTYFFGVAGLQNYGLLNDPNLSAALTPCVKANGNGNVWVYQGQINASANEIYLDVEALFYQLVAQTGGTVDQNARMTLAMSPTSQVALTATNSFGVNVGELLKKNFPNLKTETAVQYGAKSATNPQGVTGGNLVQLIVDEIEGQDVGYCAFNEKMRAHAIVKGLSSFQQKLTAGTWGAIIRMPAGISQMLGV